MCIPLAQKRLYPSPCLLMFLRDCKCQEPRFSAPRSYLATVPPQIAYLRRGQYFLSIGEYEKLSLYKYTNHFRLIFLAKLEKTLWTINMLKPKNMEIWNMIFLLTVGWVFSASRVEFQVFCIKSSNRNTFLLVGGLSNPFEKYERQIGSYPPGFGGEHKKSVKPSPSLGILLPWSSATNSPNPRNLHPPEHPKVTNLGHRVQLSIQREAFDHACRDVYGGWWLVVGGWTNPFNKNMGQSNWSKSPQIFGVEHIWVAST